jgi:hypothetical protein
MQSMAEGRSVHRGLGDSLGVPLGLLLGEGVRDFGDRGFGDGEGSDRGDFEAGAGGRVASVPVAPPFSALGSVIASDGFGFGVRRGFPRSSTTGRPGPRSTSSSGVAGACSGFTGAGPPIPAAPSAHEEASTPKTAAAPPRSSHVLLNHVLLMSDSHDPELARS